MHHQVEPWAILRDYICNSESEEVVQENQVFCLESSSVVPSRGHLLPKDGFVYHFSVLFPTIEIKVGDMVFVRPGILEK